jgi:hypothetical protein
MFHKCNCLSFKQDVCTLTKIDLYSGAAEGAEAATAYAHECTKPRANTGMPALYGNCPAITHGDGFN